MVQHKKKISFFTLVIKIILNTMSMNTACAGGWSYHLGGGAMSLYLLLLDKLHVVGEEVLLALCFGEEGQQANAAGEHRSLLDHVFARHVLLQLLLAAQSMRTVHTLPHRGT